MFCALTLKFSMRRCGKSYLLNPIFRNHLLDEGVPSDHIISIELDKLKDIRYRKPFSITGDSFPKIVVRKDIRKRWYNENGILNIGIIDFLLSNDIL